MDHLLLVPGLLCTGELFADQTANLAGSASVVVADTLSDDSIGAMAQRALAKAPPRFSLAGLSMGGYVAFEILSRAPERVERLALLDTSARADLPEQSASRRELVEKARTDGVAAVVDTLLPKLLAPRHAGDASLVGRLHAMGEAVGVEAFARQEEAIIARPDVRERLSGYALPTLVVVGEEDALTPPAIGREIADAIPNARFEIVPACGHLSTMERPDIVTPLLREFFQRR